MINNIARHNLIDAKYQQMAFWSVPTALLFGIWSVWHQRTLPAQYECCYSSQFAFLNKETAVIFHLFLKKEKILRISTYSLIYWFTTTKSKVMTLSSDFCLDSWYYFQEKYNDSRDALAELESQKSASKCDLENLSRENSGLRSENEKLSCQLFEVSGSLLQR